VESSRNHSRRKPIKKPKTAPESPEIEIFHYNISQLAKKFKLDRATIRERVELNEIEPVSTKANEKLYHLDDVEVLLSQSELNEAKLRKLDAEAELKELEVKKKLGEFASVAEFTEIVQKIFGRLHKKLAVQLPGRIANKLHNAATAADGAALLKQEISKEFDALRSDFKKYI